MKAIIIDWKKRIMDVKKGLEYLVFWEYQSGSLEEVLPENYVPVTMVDIKKKIYKRITLRYPKTGKPDGHFYICEEDAIDALPIIQGLIDSAVQEAWEVNYDLMRRLNKYQLRWVNKVWDWIVFRKFLRRLRG